MITASSSASAPTRSSARIAEVLRREIESGRAAPGQFLPSERRLAEIHRVTGKTVRRALKVLEAEALVAAEDRRGYRVLARALDPDRGNPLAFVVSRSPVAGTDSFYASLLAALQAAATRRGWSLLGVGTEGRSADGIMESLQAARACGSVVDSSDRALLERLAAAGMPLVQADAWLEEMSYDAVAQDGFAGGMLAAAWLAGRGHRRIAFIGPSATGADLQIVERCCGALGGLARAGLELPRELVANVPQQDADAAARAARELLARPDRPTAVLALWQGLGPAVARAAQDLGLAPGRDLDLVGWSVEEDYAREFLSTFPAGWAPPAITWSAARLAEACISRLLQRRAEPRLAPALTRIPVRLTLPEGQEGRGR
jgi:DNA-binding LacI/PurR family transcriptional regulator